MVRLIPDLLRLLRRAKALGQGRRTDLEEPHGESPRGGSHEADYLADRLARTDPDRYSGEPDPPA